MSKRDYKPVPLQVHACQIWIFVPPNILQLHFVWKKESKKERNDIEKTKKKERMNEWMNEWKQKIKMTNICWGDRKKKMTQQIETCSESAQ